jgi:hypothetical protein
VLATQVSFLSSKYRRDICSYTSALTRARYSLIAHSDSDYNNVLLPWSDAFPLADGVNCTTQSRCLRVHITHLRVHTTRLRVHITRLRVAISTIVTIKRYTYK